MSLEQEKAAEDGKDEFDPNIDPALLAQHVESLPGEEDDDDAEDDGETS